MCCPKSFNTRPWAVACAYTTLYYSQLMFASVFLMFIPFVFHPGMFGGMVPVEPSNPLSQVAYYGNTMYGMICFLCFGSLFVALLSLLCIVGIQKERGGLLVPYLVVKCILALLVVGSSFFMFYGLSIVDERAVNMTNYTAEMNQVMKAIVVLMILVSYWVFITPIFVVSTHCHRLMSGTTNEYISAPLIAMEVPPAHEAPSYGYAVKSAGGL